METEDLLLLGGIAVGGYVIYKTLGKPIADTGAGIATAVQGVGGGISNAGSGIGNAIGTAGNDTAQILDAITKSTVNNAQLLDIQADFNKLTDLFAKGLPNTSVEANTKIAQANINANNNALGGINNGNGIGIKAVTPETNTLQQNMQALFGSSSSSSSSNSSQATLAQLSQKSTVNHNQGSYEVTTASGEKVTRYF